VRLEGYRHQPAHTVDVRGAGQRLTLLVAPPEASAPTAHVVLMAAGRRGNTDDVDTLLRSDPPVAEVRGGGDDQRPVALRRRDPDGGRVTVAG
jgi:hypothetical protein